MEEVKDSSAGLPTDIIFECPQCGKSLAIDERGAGYIVVCPDCGTKVQVPGYGAGAAEEGAGLAAPESRSLADAFDKLRERNEHLERLRSVDMQRFEQISDELVLIQAALDRMVSVIQDATSPPPEDMPRDEVD